MRLNKSKLNKFLKHADLIVLSSRHVLPKASWVFVTYNRCPYKDPQKNPLVWAFQTVINNKLYNIKDFIVVDDNSSDYTKQCIDWLVKAYKININYTKNIKRLSCSLSRNVGLKMAKNDLVFMGDDDCLYGEYFLFGAVITYKLLKDKNPKEKIAIINLPAYEKSFYPTSTESSKIIGKVNLENTFFYHEFDKFPIEYLRAPKYIDEYQSILYPLKVDTFKGCNLCDRRLVKKVGGYEDLSMWSSSYSEHIELSYKLDKSGYSIYHQADPKIACLHLKYGSKTRDKFDRRLSKKKISGLNYGVGKIIAFSQEHKDNTGARLSDREFYITEIGSFLSFYLKISKKMGLRFSQNQYKLFIKDKRFISSTPTETIKKKQDRVVIFLIGILCGIRATELQTKKNYHDVLLSIIKDIVS